MQEITPQNITLAHSNFPITHQHMSLVERSAKKLIRRLPDSVELGDLLGNGYLGLLDALSKYDINKNDNFAAYAEIRIRGAMLDGLRSMDWVPRSVRQKAHLMQAAQDKIYSRKGRLPTTEEMADELQITTETLRGWRQECARTDCLSVDALDTQWEDHSVVSPEKNLEHNENMMLLGLAMTRLNEKQQQVMSLYYLEDLTLKEVGEVLEITESRVCQIHSEAVRKLKKILQNERSKLQELPYKMAQLKRRNAERAA